MTHEEVRTVHTLRERVKETADCGMLGVLAARARIDESKLRNWCNDFAAMPDEREVIALAQTFAAPCQDC
jgi:hypothetical protein